MPRLVPTLGYPSKRAAIAAMLADGKTCRAIATAIGDTQQRVSVQIAAIRRAGSALPPASRVPTMQPASDPHAKRDKARRLFGKTMLYIAEALDVTPEALMVMLKGVVARPLTTTRYGELLPRLAMGAELDEDGEAQFGPAGFDEPSREDDEAELDRLDEEDEDDEADRDRPDSSDSAAAGGGGAGETQDDDVAIEEVRAESGGRGRVHPQSEGKASAQAATATTQPAAAAILAAAGHVYRLRDEFSGHLLHESLDGLTSHSRYAWKGSTKQMRIVLDRNPQWKHLQPERVG